MIGISIFQGGAYLFRSPSSGSLKGEPQTTVWFDTTLQRLFWMVCAIHTHPYSQLTRPTLESQKRRTRSTVHTHKHSPQSRNHQGMSWRFHLMDATPLDALHPHELRVIHNGKAIVSQGDPWAPTNQLLTTSFHKEPHRSNTLYPIRSSYHNISRKASRRRIQKCFL